MRSLEGEAVSPSREQGRWRARVVTYGCVAIILTAGFAGLELWPLSAFRLFSEIRTAEQYSWQLTVIDTSGVEHEVNLGDLPDNYSGHAQLMNSVMDMSASEQAAVVRAWLAGANIDSKGIVTARIFLVETSVPQTTGEPPVEESRQEMLVVKL